MRFFPTLLLMVILLSGCGATANKYKEDLNTTFDNIEDLAIESETIVKSYIDKWYNTLNDPFMNQYGSLIVGSVGTVYNKYIEEGKFEELDKKQKEIEEQLSNLENPPEEHLKAYEALKELQEVQAQITDLAMHPAFGHGEVNDYRQFDDQFARAIEDYKDVRDQLEILM